MAIFGFQKHFNHLGFMEAIFKTLIIFGSNEYVF